MAGRVIFFAQKIEQLLKRVILIKHEMGKSKTFEKNKREIDKLTLGSIIKEIKSYDGCFTDNGIKVLGSLKEKRNYVSHECFRRLGFLEAKDEALEQEVFERLKDISQELQNAEAEVFDVWKSHENEYGVSKFLKRV